ncbi:hypothetical protein DYB32_008170 [Aphanomyces invadans]|uniref:Amine oxidase domain-containing protein n=1 Tax=Aphanomyces invadans TaxID=157072 RepID=A0A3R6YZJ8_9STRA|nr:hypothetical protein DYB32_008170 [Aphanomyces invadans]
MLTNAPVASINVKEGRATGVTLADGTVMDATHILSNASPSLTYLDLVGKQHLPASVVAHFERAWDTESASTKVGALATSPVMLIEDAFLDVQQGVASRRPVIEMNIPTSMDDSIAPRGHHIALLFVQYTPYLPKDGPWTDAKKAAFADQCFSVIEQYAPGFKASIVGTDILTPPDLERVFSLPRGNIFHGAMGLDQLFWLRPLGGYTDYRTPIRGLYLCSAGTHPGGGVMGACGRNAAHVVLKDSA